MEHLDGADIPGAPRTARSVFWIALSQITKLVTTLASVVVVSRLLTPHDYGLFAMAMTVMAFLQIFQSLGMNRVMIQARELSQPQLSAAFWMNVGASLLIAALMLAIAPHAGRFYGEPQAGLLCAALSITFLLTGATFQHAALLTRDFRFATLSCIEMAVNVATLLVTAVAAFYWRTVWALWLGHLVAGILNLTLLWMVSSWRPGLRTDFAGSAELFRFGRQVAGGTLVTFFARNLDSLLLARVWGSVELGLYDRAFKLMMFPLRHLSNPLGRLIVPLLSRAAEDPQAYRATATRATRALLLFVAPSLTVAAVCSEEFVLLLLGDNWGAAAPIFFWMSLAGLSQLLLQAATWVFISCGAGKAYLAWALASALTTIASFVIGVPWGGAGMAAAFCLTDHLLRVPLTLWWMRRVTPLRAWDFGAVFLPFFGNLAIIYLVRRALDPAGIGLAALCALTVLSYAICLLLHSVSRRGREDLATFWRSIGRLKAAHLISA